MKIIQSIGSVGLAFIILAGLGYGVYRIAESKSQPSPSAKNLPVPFTTQAPEADWREPWQNACEETAVIMADSFYKNKKRLTADEARQRILEIMKLKEDGFGQSQDESMERIAEIVNRADLGWTASVVADPELNAIKEEIAQGRPVIAPVDARLLDGDPYAGTLDYHVLVISGYDDRSEEFIVQDPGTKKGRNERYGYESFYKAINDYLPNAFPSGRKAVLFTAPGA